MEIAREIIVYVAQVIGVTLLCSWAFAGLVTIMDLRERSRRW